MTDSRKSEEEKGEEEEKKRNSFLEIAATLRPLFSSAFVYCRDL